MHTTPTALLLTLLPLASAHFHLHFPAARGDDDTNQATFPCGGYDTVGVRTPVSLSAGIPLSMELGHTENLISVFLAVGNEPGEAFNVELLPTIEEMGPGDFCWQAVPLPANLTLEEGTNATVQVITNAHDGGGLYNCADITFSAEAESPESCTNGTGITAEFLTGDDYVMANASASHGDHGSEGAESSSSASGTASSTAAEASATESSGAGMLVAAGWSVLGAGFLGAVAMM